MAIDVQYHPTPNPNSIKFTLNVQVVAEGSESYLNAEAAQQSPLAAAIFALGGITGVFMLGNFITVSKAPEADWGELVPRIHDVIVEHFSK